jgi:hypothetical protein
MTCRYPPTCRRRPMAGRQRAAPVSGSGESGLALLGILVLTAILLALGLFGVGGARTELRIAASEREAVEARNAAEAGARHALSLMRTTLNYDNELADGGTGGVLVGLGELRVVDGVTYRYNTLGSADRGYYVRVVDNYDETAGNDNPLDDRDRLVRIISRGQVGNAVRTLQLAVNIAGPGWAIFGKRHANLKGKGGLTDSWDSRDGEYVAVVHGQYGSVASNGNVTTEEMNINGDLTAGKKVNAKKTTVTGVITENAPLITLNPDPVPPCSPYSDKTGMSGKFIYNQNKGEFRVKGKKQAVLAPGSYCFKKMTLDDGSLLTTTGLTTITVTQMADLEGGLIRNVTHVPNNLQIRASYKAKKTCMKLGTGAEMYAIVYAPGCRTTVKRDGEFYGMIVGRCVHFENKINFHYDEYIGISELALKRFDWRPIATD